MGEFTTCNYCHLKRIKERAKKNGMKVTLITGWRGGKDVFVHPPDVKPPKGFKHKCDSKEGFNQYFTAWMMEIGKRCEC